MKKFFILLIFITISVVSVAQDVIITKDSERIEAKITEISDEEVKYKRKGFIDGPEFELSAVKVASIIFSNGEVFVFKDQPQRPNVREDESGQTDNVVSQLVETLQSSENKVLECREYAMTYVSVDKALKLGGGQYVGFYMGGQRLSDKEYKALTKETCPEAYTLLKKAKTMENVLGATALCMLSSGIVMMLYPLFGNGLDKKGTALFISGLSIGLGSGLVVLFTWGKPQRLKSESAQVFNQQCNNKKPTSSLSFGITPNGVGIVMGF